MAAPAARSETSVPLERVDTTLLALVQAVAEVTDDDREIVATILALLRSGRVRLVGTFRDEPPLD